MQQREVKGMWGRYVLFVVLSLGILMLNAILFPPKRPTRQLAEKQAIQQGIDQEDPPQKEEVPADSTGQRGIVEPGPAALNQEIPTPDQPAPPEPEGPAEEPDVQTFPRVTPDPSLITLGSLDAESRFCGMATFTNLGAALVRFELNSPRFRDLDDRSGHLGHLALDEIGHLAPDEMARRIKLPGCLVDVVGPGTPAALAGLRRGDLITSIDGRQVTSYRSLCQALKKTKPGDEIALEVSRQGEELTLSAKLGRRPLEVVRPENRDPLSFLLTLRQVDELLLDDLIDLIEEQINENKQAENEQNKRRRGDKERDPTIGLELEGLDLRTGAWDIENREQFDEPGPHTSVTFFRELPQFGLKISKTFHLEPVREEQSQDANRDGYHLVFDLKIENVGHEARQVAYQLDGPTGLPAEGKWYAYKVGRGWGGAGLRDVIVSWERLPPSVIACGKIADDNWGKPWGEQSLTYIGVDAQYFSAVMIPQKQNWEDIWFAESQPLRVGAVDKNWRKATNTSCRVISKPLQLEPAGQALEHSYKIFAGPKKPALLAKYRLGDLVYYGWFWWVAVPMLWTLHLFYAIVGNYGLAIILLTILVRGCMFPLSIKQARGAQKMQELQPEIKKIHEKYKNNAEAKVRAQQELFRKHNYNPLSGCLVLLLQFPVFIGLYRGLSVDVELRQAPLLSESIRWCSNLAAPDMLFDWSGFMPEFISSGLGFFGLGPYFNLLPVLTIALFVIQQKMFMPPPADEQQAMQHNMMKFMMIFMGFVFYKVASGLCLYFIASSLWGVAERKLLPKPTRPGTGDKAKTPKPQPAKPKPRVFEQPMPAQAKPSRLKPSQPKAPRPGSDHDGAVGRKRKKRKKKKSRGKR